MLTLKCPSLFLILRKDRHFLVITCKIGDIPSLNYDYLYDEAEGKNPHKHKMRAAPYRLHAFRLFYIFCLAALFHFLEVGILDVVVL